MRRHDVTVHVLSSLVGRFSGVHPTVGVGSTAASYRLSAGTRMGALDAPGVSERDVTGADV